MPSAWSGMNWIAGGAAAAILLPVLAIGIGMPFWIAGIISAAAGGGLVVPALAAPICSKGWTPAAPRVARSNLHVTFSPMPSRLRYGSKSP